MWRDAPEMAVVRLFQDLVRLKAVRVARARFECAQDLGAIGLRAPGHQDTGTPEFKIKFECSAIDWIMAEIGDPAVASVRNGGHFGGVSCPIVEGPKPQRGGGVSNQSRARPQARSRERYGTFLGFVTCVFGYCGGRPQLLFCVSFVWIEA